MLASYWMKTSRGVWVKAEYVASSGTIEVSYQHRIALDRSGRLVELGPDDEVLAPVDTLRFSAKGSWCKVSSISVDTLEYSELIRRVTRHKLNPGVLFYRICVHAVRLGMTYGEELGESLKWFECPISASWLPPDEHEYTSLSSEYNGATLTVLAQACDFEDCWRDGARVELGGVECHIDLIDLLFHFQPD